MKRKNLVTFLLLLTVSFMLFSLSSMKLVKTNERNESNPLSSLLKERVDKETKGMDTEQIIDYSLSLTASQLRFAARNDINECKANCIGYAQLCAAICNQALSSNGIEGKARPVVGYIESNGINWCKILKAIAPKASYKNFVKDHDFVELTIESRKYYFDPSIYDVLGKKCLSINN